MADVADRMGKVPAHAGARPAPGMSGRAAVRP
jgi:hypothetical protein